MHRAIVSNRLMGSGSEQELPSPGYRQTSPGTADESLAPFPHAPGVRLGHRLVGESVAFVPTRGAE
jgi:hypothetical protein